MKQMTLARGGFEQFGKTTKTAAFVAEMDQVLPWGELCALIEPHYPKAGGPGRPPVGLQRMLRIDFLQHWFNLSDRAVEEALYEPVSMREFVGIDLGREPAPEETTICKFRHLLECHDLAPKDLRASRCASAGQGLSAEQRDDRGRHLDRSAEFDQERQGRA